MKKQLLFMLFLLLGVVQTVVAQEKEAYAVLSDGGKTVTFYYDTQKANRTRVVKINADSFGAAYNTATTAVFDASFADYRPTSTAYWFCFCTKLTSVSGMENLNTSNVTTMRHMFQGCSSLTSLDVSHFNTSDVTNLSGMFYDCRKITSLDVSNFNTSNVTNMQQMFDGCWSLTSLDVSNFNTEKVTKIGGMFLNCSSLTSLDVSNINTSNVTDISNMFHGCSSLTSLDVSNFITDKVTDMGGLFHGCSSLTSLDVSNFNTSNVTNMWGVFSGCSTLNSLDVSNFNTSNVTRMDYMFEGCSSLTTLDVSNFNTSNVTIMTGMFSGCSSLPLLNVSNFNTSNVTSMCSYGQNAYYDTGMFSRCSSLTSLDVSNFITDKVTDMGGLFYGCSSLTSLDVSSFNTSNVTRMDIMFSDCSSLTSLDVSSFNTSNVQEMTGMFSDCSSLASLDLSSFNTSNVKDMTGMFSGCRSLASLDLSIFNTSNVTGMEEMFKSCSSLRFIYVSDGWTTDAIRYLSRETFSNCTALVGGAGTVYDDSHIDYTYARIDDGADAPGYLTNITDKIVGTTITLNVCDDGGQDITNNTSIVWYDGDGKQIGTGNKLNGVGEDAEIYYSVVLDETSGRVYRDVNMQMAEINDEGVITCQLKKIDRVMLKGRVSGTDIEKNTVTVNVRQMLNGKWQQNYSTRTDAQGLFCIEVYDDTTDIVISGDGYLDATLHRDGFSGNGNVGTIPVNLLTGFAVTANITMKKTATAGEIAEVNVWNGNLNDIDFSLTNKTKGATIDDIAVQNGNVIIKSGAKVGDEISLTAKSKQGVFADATTTFVLSGGANSFDLQLTELGGIDATCAATNNGTTIGYLYDSNGMLAARGSYRGETLSLRHVESGTYTLVSMGQSLLLGCMTKLSDISEVGLSEGTDYVATTVNVTDGTLTAASVSTVPKMNDSRFYHTTGNTYFSANKSMVTLGNYISMSAHVDFKAEYADKIDDVTLTIELPEGCQMLENTVIANRQSVPYTLNGNTITIPLSKEQYESSVRFCIVPTVHKDYTVTAMASFNLDGQKQQPIGTAQFEAKGLSLSAPQMTESPTVTFTGTAKGRSEVSIYDNDVLIGTTTSKADGSWSAECELFKPFNPSFHNIYAKITTGNGLELTSETQQVEYNKISIVPQKVEMSYYNGWYRKQIDVEFDLQNGTTTPSSYPFFTATDFTFLADFTVNDPSRVKNVNIKVLNSDGTVRTLPATFDEKQRKWVATTKYSSARRLPKNVTVDYSLVPGIEDDEQRKDIFKEQASALVSTAYAIKDLYDDKVLMTPIEEDEEHALFELRTEENQEPLYFRITTEDYADMDKMMSTNQFVYMKQEGDIIGTYTESLENGHTVYAVNIPDSTSFKLELWNPSAPSGAKAINAITDLVANSVTALKASVSNATFLNKALGVLGHLGDAIDASEYWSVRGDFENMCNRILMYSELLQDENKKTFRAITSKCPDGSYRLSRDDMSHYYDELKDIADDESEFSQQYYKYLDEYKSKLSASVVTYCVTLGVGRALNALENLSIFRRANGAVNRLFNRYFTSSVSTETTAGILSSVVGTVAGNIIDTGIGQVEKIFDYKDFDAVRDRTLSWASKEYEGIVNRYIDLQFTMKEDYKMCHDKDDKDEEKKDEPYDEKSEDKSGYNNKPNFKGKGITPIIDPSGYVYEAVLSNRLPGVTTTVYEQVNGVAVKWNAEEYSQENPLLTDETGFYRWDVPQGMWQVKYEKEGYETTYSEWLPVPPPQLDVNICMKQSTPPTVKQMRGYETGITVEMAKYMKPETMTAQNITVTRNGEVESGSIEMLNAEKAPLGEETYVSKVRFVPENDFNSSDVVVVTIHKEVESYCGVQMTADHVETVKIESEVKSIVVDDAVTVPYQGERDLRIVVLPKEASVGKTLRVSTSSQMIASINTSEVVIDEDGAVNLTIGGELPGGAVLDFAVEGTDVTATTKAQVVAGGDIVETPTASINSGETIISGTKLTLSCTTSGATIYYTLDGSCPCDEASRILYNGPIAITKDVTVKAMAVKDGMDDSDVATFVYTVQYEQVETPQASVAETETVMSGQTLELTCATDGATIYYTLDGTSPADNASRMKYSSPIVLTEDVTVKAIAVKNGMDDSDVATFVYTVQYEQVESPQASIASTETVMSGQTLELTCATDGATIYYTLDGSSPTDESARMKYSSPIVLTEDVTVKAIAVKDGMDNSDVATFVYTVQYEQVETPQASIAGNETVMSGQTLELTCATDGATIYYTLDGSSPTDESARMKYSSPIVLTEDVTVKAIAVKDGMDNSDVATFVYTVTGIKDVVTDRIEEDTPIYNVSGQRLNKTRKGINIIGGRKFSVK